MSAPGALKAVSHRDSLAKTVRLLTRDGIAVQFRGHQPYVATKGNKALKLVLPELNDDASPELLAAIHGYLDHEVDRDEGAEDEAGTDGHGDGEGQDDGDDGEDADTCAGNAEDEEADGDGSSADQSGEEDGEDDAGTGDEDGDHADADDQEEGDRPGDGKSGLSITDALKQLDPTERKALFLYKQRKMSVSEISKEMSKSDSEVSGMLRNARRRLGQLMKGSRN